MLPELPEEPPSGEVDLDGSFRYQELDHKKKKTISDVRLASINLLVGYFWLVADRKSLVGNVLSG